MKSFEINTGDMSLRMFFRPYESPKSEKLAGFCDVWLYNHHGGMKQSHAVYRWMSGKDVTYGIIGLLEKDVNGKRVEEGRVNKQLKFRINTLLTHAIPTILVVDYTEKSVDYEHVNEGHITVPRVSATDEDEVLHQTDNH